METGPLLILIYLLICLAIFILLRELMLWYWKIYKRMEIAERNNELVRRNNILLETVLFQLGSDGFVTIESKNGTKKITVSIEEWIRIKSENKDGFRIVSNSLNSNNI